MDTLRKVVDTLRTFVGSLRAFGNTLRMFGDTLRRVGDTRGQAFLVYDCPAGAWGRSLIIGMAAITLPAGILPAR